MYIFLTAILLISIVIEGTLSPLPLVLISLLSFTIFKRGAAIFPIAFAAGLLLDSFLVRGLGTSGLFFLVFVFLTHLYQRKYEINSYQFVLASGFAGSITYLKTFGIMEIWPRAIISAAIAVIIFSVIRSFMKNQSRKENLKTKHYGK